MLHDIGVDPLPGPISAEEEARPAIQRAKGKGNTEEPRSPRAPRRGSGAEGGRRGEGLAPATTQLPSSNSMLGLPTLSAPPCPPLLWRCATAASASRACTTTASASHYIDDGPFAVAPMMDYTDRFLRYMLRQLSSRATLYTEMVTANTIVHCPDSELPRFLQHDGADPSQPVVLQLGGADPAMLRRAMEISAPWGYTAVNLNVGCPSDRVAGSGCFGAALMRSPDLVGDCCAAMSDATHGDVPVTVKCRIGVTSDKAQAAVVDDEATYDELARFVDTVSTRGHVRAFCIHARKAVLGGLSPAQNRQIPPLRYELVERLAVDFPELRFSLNGGVDTLAKCAAHVHAPDNLLSGVMVGRAVVARPWEWATVDTALYGEASNPAPSRRAVLDGYCDFADRMQKADRNKIRRVLVAPALNLFSGEPHGKTFRKVIDEICHEQRDLGAGDVIRLAAERALRDDTLDAPPGQVFHMNSRTYLAADEFAAVRAAERAERAGGDEQAAAAQA